MTVEEHTKRLAAARRTIAAGGNPVYEHTLTHREHGELTFRGRLPLAMDSLRHSIRVDELLAELSPGVEPSFQTKVTAAAIAGLSVPLGNAPGKALMLELPVVDEQAVETEEGTQTVRHYYDVTAEKALDFLHELWLDYSLWRGDLLTDETVEAVGESSAGPSTS